MDQGKSGFQPAFADGVAYVDGAYVPLHDARIPILDRGFVRSDATYDVAHVWKGRFFRLDDHIDRFVASMSGLRMALPQSKRDIADICARCVSLSGLRDAYVQMTCTRGVPPRGSRDPRRCENKLYVFAQPFVWIANDEQRRDGVSMVISAVQRIPPESVDPRIKNFHWLDMTMGIFEAYDRDALVPVLVDRDGHVTEGPGFNVFAWTRGVLATPDRGVFEGITRRTVIELAREMPMPVEVRPVPIGDLRGADEIFLTSTAGGVVPVTRLDGKPVGIGTPGPVTRRMTELYWDRHRHEPFMTPVLYRDGP